MKKLFYLLALLSVSVFMISCSDTETGGGEKTPPPATGIDLASLDSLVGDYVVDNYSVSIKTVETANPLTVLGDTTIAKDNYTLVQGFMSDAAITVSGNKLKVSSLISNDSIVAKVASLGLNATELANYHNIYNLFVTLEDTPALVGDKLGDIATGKYEITKLGDKQLKFNYKHEEPQGTSTRTENGWIILTKKSNAATTVPTTKETLYTVRNIQDASEPMNPIGKYAITKYVYVKNGGAPVTITATPGTTTEKNLIGGLGVEFNFSIYKIIMSIAMQTGEANGFGIDADSEGTPADKYIFRKINITPLIGGGSNMVTDAFKKLGAVIDDEETITFKLVKYDPTDQYAVKHDLPLETGDTITLTLKVMNDGGLFEGAPFSHFKDKKFFVSE